jgi:hypothetical protein
VITGFEIVPGAPTSDTAHVRVQYHTVGWLTAGDSLHARFTPHDTLEVQPFTLLRRGQGWAISAPQIDQHVLVDSALTKSSLGAEDRRKLDALRMGALSLNELVDEGPRPLCTVQRASFMTDMP